MAETTTKSKPVVTISANGQQSAVEARFAGVVDRTSELSDELLTSLETGERAAIEAVGQFVIAVEEALPQEVAGTSEVAKKVTESGLQMADRLIHTQYEFLRKVIDSTAKSLRSRDGAKLHAAH
jgi:hypothetical protein